MSNFKKLMMVTEDNEMEQLYWMSIIDRTVDDIGTALEITSIASDADGHMYAFGQYGQIYKYNPSGGIVLNTKIRVIGSDGNEYNLPSASSCHVDSLGNVYITGGSIGGSLSQVFVVKLNSSGNVIWYKTLTPSSGRARGFAITTDSSGNVYVAGYTRYISNFQTSQSTTLVLKLNSSGVLQWARSFGGIAQIVLANGIAIDGSGNVIVGTYEYFSPGFRQDAFVLKYNSSGTLLTQQAYGQDGQPGRGERTTWLGLDGSDNRYTLTNSDTTSTDRNVHLNKYNSSGTIQWQRATIGVPPFFGRGIKVDTTGKIYIVFESFNNSVYTTYIAHFDTSGNLVWQRSLVPVSPYNGIRIYSMSLDSYNAVGISGNVVDSSTNHKYGLVARLPGDGTLTGVYGGISYASSSITWAAPTGEAAYGSRTGTRTNGAESMTVPAQGEIASERQSIKSNIFV